VSETNRGPFSLKQTVVLAIVYIADAK